MASTLEYTQYVAEQLSGAGSIQYKKLFGEYGLWRNGKFFGTVENNQFYVKITRAGQELMPDAFPVAPHGGKPGMYLVEELEDTSFLKELVERTCEELPEPKPRTRAAKTDKTDRASKTTKTEKLEKWDCKKKYKEFYSPKRTPSIIDIPEMSFIMVRGNGNPNTAKSYKQAMEILYGLSFTIKMSRMGGHQPEGYFEYVVPPLEGLWWVEDAGVQFDGINVMDKETFCWKSMIRQPEFVTKEVFEWAKSQLLRKKPELDFSFTSFETYTEGLCCQAMHIGPYDEEPVTIKHMYEYIKQEGFVADMSEKRLHHEIYLGDPRRTKPENLKTIIRHPICRKV